MTTMAKPRPAPIPGGPSERQLMLHQRGACSPDTAHLFTPNEDSIFDWNPARAICQRCPVREDCLEEALEHPSAYRHSLMGGYTLTERTRMAARGQRPLF